LKPGAAAAFDTDAQHRPGGLPTQDFADPARRALGYGDVATHFISAIIRLQRLSYDS
jgi:hypothetical protein